jgi:transcriptional regulator with XRE-family HTH domain
MTRLNDMPVSDPHDGSSDGGLGARLRLARSRQALRLKDVAAKSGFSVSFISQVERGLANPSVGSLKRLADALGVSAAGLFFGADSESADPGIRDSSSPVFTPAGQRKSIRYPDSEMTYELVVPDLTRSLEVLWLEAPPGSSTGEERYSHAGEECVLVIAGELLMTVGEESWTLTEGDSLYFQGDVPHGWVNASEKRALAVWISTPPTF